MDPDGARRLNRSSPSCLNSGAQRTDFFHGLVRRILDGQQRVTATFRRPDGRTLHVRTTTQAEPEQRAIYDARGVDPQPGGVRKTII